LTAFASVPAIADEATASVLAAVTMSFLNMLIPTWFRMPARAAGWIA